MKTAIASWSGGKDSCLACYKAIGQGYQIEHLLNFISKEYKRCCFHGIEAKLIGLQGELLGIPLFQKEVSPDMDLYEKEFKEAVSELKKAGAASMVFGDIYLDEHLDWVERVCKDLGVEAVEPLWGMKPEEVVKEFITAGFKAVIVSCQADKLGKEFIGRELSLDLMEELREKDVCPCGENGEFHTLVIDGPLFKRGIKIQESEPVLKHGFWDHWFLNIKSFGS